MKNTHFLVFILRLQTVRPLLFLLVWIGCLETSAQSGWQPFERFIDFENRVEAGVTLGIINDTLYFFSKGHSLSDPFSLRKTVLNKANLDGQVAFQRMLFRQDSSEYEPAVYTSILLTPDSNLLYYGLKTDNVSSTYRRDVFFAKLSFNGDTIWTRQHYRRDTSEVLRHCRWTPGGDLFCVGFSQYKNANGISDLDAYAGLFDTLGKKIWSVDLNHSVNDGMGPIVRISQNPKRFEVIGGSGGPQGFVGKRWVLDGQGTLVHVAAMGSSGGSGLICFPALDGGFICYQSIKSAQSGYYPNKVVKYDSSWGLQWQRLLNDLNDASYLSHFEVLSDSSYLACGWAYTDENPTSNYAQLVKLDQNGSIQWYRRYYLDNINTSAHLTFLKEYPSIGAVYGIGTILRPQASNNSDAWLVRFDSVGCLEPGCDTIVGQEFPLPLQPENLSVFPNPASGPMAVDIPPKLREPARELIMRNLAGQQVQSHTLTGAPRKMVDVGELPSGLYLVEVWGSDGLLGQVKFVRQ